MSLVLYRNAHLATPIDPGRPLAGPDQGRILHQPAGALLCRAGTIAAVGEEAAVLRELQGAIPERTVDCGGRCLVPGFVDPHTHMCFAERREAEFGLRLEGLPYLEILRRGGGILASVQAVRPASEATLLENHPTPCPVGPALRHHQPGSEKRLRTGPGHRTEDVAGDRTPE